MSPMAICAMHPRRASLNAGVSHCGQGVSGQELMVKREALRYYVNAIHCIIMLSEIITVQRIQ